MLLWSTGLEDDELWAVARSVVSPEQQEEISLLLDKNKVAITELVGPK